MQPLASRRRLKLIFTTNPGIEDVAAEEIEAKLAATTRWEQLRGRVVADVPRSRLHLVEELRSIHRARILLAEATICGEKRCLEEIRSVVVSSPVSEFVTPWTSFAVRAERAGEHEYTSIDVARVAGDAVIEAVRSKFGERPPVDLDSPAVIVAVDVLFDKLYVSIELSGDLSWHRRGYRVYDHPAALKPTLAYAMIRLSGARDGETILDPMCGGGTVAIEAAQLLESSKVICNDFNPKHIRGAKLNAEAALVRRRIRFTVGDAREIDRIVGEPVDRIVSNPPYGIRLGNPKAVREVYRGFLRAAARILRGTAALITTEYEFVRRVASELGYEVLHERRVAHGDLWPHIIVLSAPTRR